jgi:class 3 adenylate cyclase
LEIACAQCGRDGSPADEFCAWCGATLRAAAGGRAVGGERKQATVLFADIVGSTHLIANLDAEEAMGRLRPVLAAMAQAVRRFDGAIIRSLGDGLKAAFGAPRAQEGHALLACKAALAMQEAVAALPSAPPIRVGLHSGEVVAGELDTGSAIEHETVGVTVHLASRIEQLAEPGGICLSRACRQLVLAYCDTAPLGLRSVKGFDVPIEVHRLIGLKPTLASAQFHGTRLTPFLGREHEFAVLQRALAAAEQAIRASSASPPSRAWAKAGCASSSPNGAAGAASTCSRRGRPSTGTRRRCSPCWRCCAHSSASHR